MLLISYRVIDTTMAKTRVQLDLRSEETDELDRLRGRFGLRSRADTVRAALAITEWVESESKRGRKVVSVGGDYVSHLVVPGITTAVDR